MKDKLLYISLDRRKKQLYNRHEFPFDRVFSDDHDKSRQKQICGYKPKTAYYYIVKARKPADKYRQRHKKRQNCRIYQPRDHQRGEFAKKDSERRIFKLVHIMLLWFL